MATGPLCGDTDIIILAHQSVTFSMFDCYILINKITAIHYVRLFARQTMETTLTLKVYGLLTNKQYIVRFRLKKRNSLKTTTITNYSSFNVQV